MAKTEDTCTPVAGAMWCPIYVFIDRKTKKVNVIPYNLKVSAPSGTTVTIVWISLDGKFKKNKHGIVVANTPDAGKLRNGRPTDKDGENPSEVDNSPNYAMDLTNFPINPIGIHYTLKYEGKGQDLECDPTINSDGSGG